MSEQATRIDATLLPQLRGRAARLDPLHADTYAAMPIDRWQKGAEVAAHLLLEHPVHLLHRHGGNDDVHRLDHSRTVSVLLNTASEIDLVVGLSVLVVASEHLGSEPRTGD